MAEPLTVAVPAFNMGIDITLDEVEHEVHRARSLHAPIHSLHEAHSIMEEEFDEFWDEVKRNPRKMTDQERVKWQDHIREELVQLAAMCVRTIVDCL